MWPVWRMRPRRVRPDLPARDVHRGVVAISDRTKATFPGRGAIPASLNFDLAI